MAAPTDRLNELAYWNAINSYDFQNRCLLQFLISAIAVTTESTSTPSHTARLALAGQLLSGSIDAKLLASWVMTNTTIQGEVVTDYNASPQNAVGTSVNDSDIEFQVNSVFTGVAISLPSTATSTI